MSLKGNLSLVSGVDKTVRETRALSDLVERAGEAAAPRDGFWQFLAGGSGEGAFTTSRGGVPREVPSRAHRRKPPKNSGRADERLRSRDEICKQRLPEREGANSGTQFCMNASPMHQSPPKPRMLLLRALPQATEKSRTFQILPAEPGLSTMRAVSRLQRGVPEGPTSLALEDFGESAAHRRGARRSPLRPNHVPELTSSRSV
jgi:hypothetical protein